MSDTLNLLNLKQYVDFPTHTGGNTLDLIISPTDSNMISNPIRGSLITDHYSLDFQIKSSRNIPDTSRTIHTRLYKRISNDKYVNTLKNLSKHHHDPTPQDFDTLNLNLEKMINQLAPFVKITVPSHPLSPWFTSELKDYKKQLRNIEKMMSKNPSQVNTRNYTTLRNTYTNKLREHKSKYFSDLLCEKTTTCKQMYQITDSLLGRKTERMLPDGIDSSIAHSFHDFFISKVQKIIDKLHTLSDTFLTPILKHAASLDSLIPPTYFDLMKIIKQFKKNSPTDPIPTNLLHDIAEEIIEPIHDAITISLHEGFVPKSLKTATIIPLLKKNNLDKNILSNYRPVSQLSTLSKVLEKVVATQILTYLNENKLLNSLQSAYQPHKSTETALTRVSNDILVSLDKKHITIITLIDLSSAFDTLNHELITHRLRQLGIKDTALKWFISFLTDRTFTVKINNTSSKSAAIKYGVPQGSVLGPIIFNICIDNISRIIKKHPIKYHMYADDLQLYVEVESTEKIPIAMRSINNCLDEIKNWYNENSLCINMNKTEALIIHNNGIKIPNEITLFNMNFKCYMPIRNLGFIFEPSFNFKNHIDKIFKIANFSLYNIRQIRRSITKKACESLVRSLVLLHFDYCNLLLIGLPESHLTKLIKLQRKSVRVIFDMPKLSHDSITTRMQQLHWLPLIFRIEYKLLITVHNAIHHGYPTYICDLLKIKKMIRSRRETHEFILEMSYYNSNVGYRSFSLAASKLWNKLPNKLRTIREKLTFKKSLKTYLFKAAYSL